MSNAYSRARHWAGKADDYIRRGAAMYQAATPIVAAAMEAYAGEGTKMAAATTKKVLDHGLVNYAKAPKVGKATAKIADTVLY